MKTLKACFLLGLSVMLLSACTAYVTPVAGPGPGPHYRPARVWMPGHYNRFGGWVPAHWRYN